MAPANPENDHFFGNLAKSGSGQNSSRVYRMPDQLQYVQLITDKTTANDLSTGVFTSFISVIWTKNTKLIAIS